MGPTSPASLILHSSDDKPPRTNIVPLPDSWLKAEGVARCVAERCTKYKWITGGEVFLPETPTNPSGKILRKVLRDMAAKEIAEVRVKL